MKHVRRTVGVLLAYGPLLNYGCITSMHVTCEVDVSYNGAMC